MYLTSLTINVKQSITRIVRVKCVSSFMHQMHTKLWTSDSPLPDLLVFWQVISKEANMASSDRAYMLAIVHFERFQSPQHF